MTAWKQTTCINKLESVAHTIGQSFSKSKVQMFPTLQTQANSLLDSHFHCRHATLRDNFCRVKWRWQVAEVYQAAKKSAFI